MGWDDVQRAQFARDGCVVLRNVLSAQQLDRLNAVYDREVDGALSDEQAAEPFTATPMSRDGKYSALDPAAVTNDGHRFRLESLNHDLPLGSRFWDQSFIDLVDLPGVIEIVTELVTDVARWHDTGARAPPAGAPAALRLSHHNMFLRPPWGVDAPADTGGGLHGGGNRDGPCTISVAYELVDVGPADGGFGWIPGSHRNEFQKPDDRDRGWRHAWSTEALRGPDWPAHMAINKTPATAGDAIIFSEHLTHGTLPWEADTERRTVFFKYALYGRPRGDNCAYYDLSDPRLHPEQLAILDGGAWGGPEAGLARHTERLAGLEIKRAEYREQIGSEHTGLEQKHASAPAASSKL